MGNKCYSNSRRGIRNATSNFIGLTSTSQHISRVTQYHIFHDKSLRQQHQNRYKMTPEDIKQNHVVDLFVLPDYNIEVLTNDLNNEQECVICFEPFCQQDIVARLECLCIYHKKCLDEWSQRNPCCPLHMDQISAAHLNRLFVPSSISQEQQKQSDNNFCISNENLQDNKSKE